jgi:hypothetical protein
MSDGAEVGNESKRDGVPPEGILMLGSDCTEFGGVCIDMKLEEGTEVVVSSQIWDDHTKKVGVEVKTGPIVTVGMLNKTEEAVRPPAKQLEKRR